MKATPSVAKATASKHMVPMAIGLAKDPREAQDETLGLSAEALKARAFTASQVLTQILESNRSKNSFRHWGINE
jgi:hypothetical protein